MISEKKADSRLTVILGAEQTLRELQRLGASRAKIETQQDLVLTMHEKWMAEIVTVLGQNEVDRQRAIYGQAPEDVTERIVRQTEENLAITTGEFRALPDE